MVEVVVEAVVVGRDVDVVDVGVVVAVVVVLVEVVVEAVVVGRDVDVLDVDCVVVDVPVVVVARVVALLVVVVATLGRPARLIRLDP